MASELRVDKIIPVDGIGIDTSSVKYGGGIVQIVKGGSNTRLTVPTNTGQYYNSYVNATITPKFSTSKILIVGTGDVQCQADTTVSVKFARNFTNADGAVQTNVTLLGGGGIDGDTVNVSVLVFPHKSVIVTEYSSGSS